VTRQKMNVFCTAYIIKMGLTVAMFIFFMLLALSKAYLGAESYDQCLFGASIGIVFAYVGHYNVKPYFLGMQDSMSKVALADGKPYYKVKWNKYYFGLLYIVIIPLAISLLIYKIGQQQ